MTVMIGTSAARSTWRSDDVRVGQALGARRPDVVVAEHLEHGRSG